MNMLSEYPESTAIIRFQDCDPLGHLNNAKYFDYFFNSREDLVPEKYGVNPVTFFKKYQSGWVIYNHQISYLRSALPGERVAIRSGIIFYDHDTVVTEYLMTDLSRQQLMAVLWATSKFIDGKTGKKSTHPEEVVAFLERAYIPGADYHPTKFQDRIRVVKTLLSELVG
ncbi:acyl-CoA thioesterase [Eisenibacter elegans]|jgi:acyl-CoA thioester hydrolase|uniref:acyl-CoA thioesterase n=1 Tax=Eisenibacter elegans TaxID=997 RepID=UPI00047CCE04|nr:acyl-CoA thioesterase [Eisenibacter elegans]